MSAQNNGGPAFPVTELDQISGQIHDQHLGMSLRDYFAAKAMSGAAQHIHEEYARNTQHAAQCMAVTAYEIADAMLAERAKVKP